MKAISVSAQFNEFTRKKNLTSPLYCHFCWVFTAYRSISPKGPVILEFFYCIKVEIGASMSNI